MSPLLLLAPTATSGPAGKVLAHVAVEAARYEQVDGSRRCARQRVEQREEFGAVIGATLIERRPRVRVGEAEEQALAVVTARPRARQW